MKNVKFLVVLIAFFCISLNVVSASERSAKVKKTAESVLAMAASMNSLTTENAALLKAEVRSLSVVERVRLAKMAVKQAKEAQRAINAEGTEKAKAGLYVLAVVLPPVAVGIHTQWKIPTLYNVLWCCLGYLPGVIHAFIVLGK